MVENVTVIGAGIVGLSCAFFLQNAGIRVTIVDPHPEGDKASHGNAAGLAVTECVPVGLPGQLQKVPGWLLDPLGPLFIKPTYIPKLAPWMLRFLSESRIKRVHAIANALHALNSRVFADFAPIFEATSYQSHVHREGAIVAYANKSSFRRCWLEWELKRARGVKFKILNKEELTDLEPSLGPTKTAGVLQSDWAHIDDPKDLLHRLLRIAIERGAEILSDRVERVGSASGGATTPTLRLASGRDLGVQTLVVAAGAWSGQLVRSVGDWCLLESERGYNTTLPTPGIQVNREIIFAEEKFVATPMSPGLRIGGAAEFTGLSPSPNFARSTALLKLASLHLPNLNVAGGSQWMGQRPATPDSLPIIGQSPRNPNIYYAFGHGHLGLTQGPTTGRLIADLICHRPLRLDIQPYRIERFEPFGSKIHNGFGWNSVRTRLRKGRRNAQQLH